MSTGAEVATAVRSLFDRLVSDGMPPLMAVYFLQGCLYQLQREQEQAAPNS